MNYWQLRNQFYDLICFNINQVYAWQASFDKNKMYSPSYVSLHSALAFYGIIPEAIVQTTAVSSLKNGKLPDLT